MEFAGHSKTMLPVYWHVQCHIPADHDLKTVLSDTADLFIFYRGKYYCFHSGGKVGLDNFTCLENGLDNFMYLKGIVNLKIIIKLTAVR